MRHDRRMHATERGGRHRSDDVRIVALSPGEFTVHSDEAMRIYAKAMGYSAQTGVQRAISARRHTSNAGFACRVAEDGDGKLVGFGYGYTTVPGQWWHDLVRRAMSPEDQGWLGNAFELSEMHVLPASQGAGSAAGSSKPSTATFPTTRWCCRHLTTTRARSGSTAGWDSSTWPVTTCSPETPGRSRYSAPGSRSARSDSFRSAGYRSVVTAW